MPGTIRTIPCQTLAGSSGALLGLALAVDRHRSARSRAGPCHLSLTGSVVGDCRPTPVPGPRSRPRLSPKDAVDRRRIRAVLQQVGLRAIGQSVLPIGGVCRRSTEPIRTTAALLNVALRTSCLLSRHEPAEVDLRGHPRGLWRGTQWAPHSASCRRPVASPALRTAGQDHPVAPPQRRARRPDRRGHLARVTSARLGRPHVLTPAPEAPISCVRLAGDRSFCAAER